MKKTELIALDLIDGNPYQRQEFVDTAKVQEIAESLKQNLDAGIGVLGLLQVPTARKVGDRYQLAFGHHRYQAFLRLSQEDGLAAFNSMPLTIEDLNDQAMFEAMAGENLQRRDISFIEEAEVYHTYMTTFNKTSIECAARFGKTEELIRSRLIFLQLPDSAKEAAQKGEINVTTARTLVSVNKIGGDEMVDRTLKAMGAKRFEDAPAEAIENVLQNAPNVTRIYNATYGWFNASKNFPRKHLPKLTTGQISNLLGLKPGAADNSGYEVRSLIEQYDAPLTAEAYPLLAEHQPGFDQLAMLINPPACPQCPFHTVIEGNHFCGIKLCKERKEAAWEQKELDDVSKKLGVPLYQDSDGRMVQLDPQNPADKKLWNDGVADLRLAHAKYMYNNFDGVGMDLKVVIIGETAKKRIEAEAKNRANSKDVGEKVNRELQEKIENTQDQFELRFGWEVAAGAFATAVAGLAAPFLEFLLADYLNFDLCDASFPEGSDDFDELVAAARKMKKAEGLKQMHRLMAYGILYREVLDSPYKWRSGNKKNPIVGMAKFLQAYSAEWGVKLGKDFMTRAEKYQAELDAAIKEISQPKKPTAIEKKRGKLVANLQNALAGKK